MALQRQSNIELCRMASILLVMILHSSFNAIAREAGEPSFIIYYISSLSIIGVNVFVLITGYFSATPKKTSFINLAFICFFWMLFKIVCRWYMGSDISIQNLFFITDSNWFIPCYIGLLLMTPILNSYCNIASKKQLLGGVISLICVQVWFDLIPPYPNLRLGSHEGYSFFSFGVLYLLGRYLKLYGFPQFLKKYSLLLFMLLSLPTALLASVIWRYEGVLSHHAIVVIVERLYAYNSPLVIASAVSFLAIFLNIKFDSKIINHLAKSSLAALLGHMAFTHVYKDQFRYIYHNYSGLGLILLWILSIFIVYFSCVLIDQIRLVLYKPIERILKARISNNSLF